MGRGLARAWIKASYPPLRSGGGGELVSPEGASLNDFRVAPSVADYAATPPPINQGRISYGLARLPDKLTFIIQRHRIFVGADGEALTAAHT